MDINSPAPPLAKSGSDDLGDGSSVRINISRRRLKKMAEEFEKRKA